MADEEKVARLRALAEEARAGIQPFDDLQTNRGWLSHLETLERTRFAARAAAFEASADIVAGVVV